MKQKIPNRFYVYIHKRLDDKIFYVGKGCRNRAYTKHYRNDEWHKEAAKGYKIEIVEDNLLELDSYKLEKKLIAEIGLQNLTNCKSGGTSLKTKNLIEEAYKKLEELRIIFDLYYNFEEYNKIKYFREWFNIIGATEMIKEDMKDYYAVKH